MSAHTHDASHAHQFDSLEQQNATSLIGFWSFLVTEVLFFGGLFAVYAVYRFRFPEAYEHVSHAMDLKLGGLNTVILLTSSFTMVLAVNYTKHYNRAKMIGYLWITFLLATAFLVVKSFEWKAKYDHGLMIGHLFHPHEAGFGSAEHLVLCLYFFMTGLHGVHVIIGMGVISWLLYLGYTNKLSSSKFMPVECVGLYWHFVDLVWVYLFPLFYLVHTI